MNEDDKKELNRDVNDVLKKIDAHPKHAVTIANELQIEVGKVNDAVLALRSRGWPICGDDAYEGYYFGSLAELEKTAQNLSVKERMLRLAIHYMEEQISREAGCPG